MSVLLFLSALDIVNIFGTLINISSKYFRFLLKQVFRVGCRIPG